MKIIAIIQARMGSTRLPGKILKEVLDKPLLEYQIERVRRSKLIDEIVIATTINESEQPIIDFCNHHSLVYYRGSEEDVLSRYFEAAKKYNANLIVRLTSDCPIIDSDIIDKVIQYYLDHKDKYDYVSNTIKRTYPRGYDVEVFPFSSLKKAYENAELEAEREHVTPFIYRRASLFNLGYVLSETDNSNLRLTVDTSEDYLLIKKIISELYKDKPKFTGDDVIELLTNNPNWLKINSEVEQKKL